MKFFFRFSSCFQNVESILAFGVFFVKEIVVLNIGFGFCVFNSILEHRLKIFFDPENRTKSPPPKIENVPRSVKHFRIEDIYVNLYIYIYIYLYIYIYIHDHRTTYSGSSSGSSSGAPTSPVGGAIYRYWQSI